MFLRLLRYAMLLTILAFHTAASEAAPADGVSFGDPDITYQSGAAVDPGDVYGQAHFSLDAGPKSSISRELTTMLETLVQQKYGNNDGSYLLTIELQRDGKTLVTQPLITLSFTNKKFLFVDVSKEQSTQATLSGILWNEGSIDRSNNDVQLAIKSYYKAASSFDLSLFEALNDVSGSLGIAAKLDTIGVTTSVLQSVQTALDKALSSADKTEELFTIGMSFAQVGQSDGERIEAVKVPVSYWYHSGGKAASGRIDLTVETASRASDFRFASDKFVSPSPSVILENAKLWSSASATTIVDYLTKNGSDDVRSFLAAVRGNGYQGSDVYARCSELLSSYHQYLNNRDSLALLWATISEYRVGFRKSNALECLEGRRQQFDDLGLPTADLITYLQGP